MNERTEIARIRDFLGTQPDLVLAIVFGSVASGRAKADSDLDIAVGGRQALGTERKRTLIGELAELSGSGIDLIDLNTVGEPLLGQILAGGRRVLGNNQQYAALISRHLFDQADFLPYRQRLLAERRAAWLQP